jgi:hypothetical protein
MSEPPKFELQIVSADELQRILDQPKFQSQLAKCKVVRTRVSQGNPWLDTQETKELVRHLDPATDDEILLVAEYTYADASKSKVSIPLRAWTGDKRYELRRI